MKHAIYGIVRARGVCPVQQWHFIYLCCILYCKCGVDHGMGSQITMYVWRVCKGQLLCMFWRSQLSVLQRHNLMWRVDRQMNRQTNWWMVWKTDYHNLLGGKPFHCCPEINRLVSLFFKNRKLFFMFHVTQYCLCTLFHSKLDICSLFPWDKCHFPLFPKTPGSDSIMWIPYLAICLPGRIKKRQIDNWSVNKRMVGRKLEMSTRSGSNYLTLAGKSRFWYQVAPGAGALRPGFKSILVLQSSWWGSGSWLLC